MQPVKWTERIFNTTFSSSLSASQQPYLWVPSVLVEGEVLIYDNIKLAEWRLRGHSLQKACWLRFLPLHHSVIFMVLAVSPSSFILVSSPSTHPCRNKHSYTLKCQRLEKSWKGAGETLQTHTPVHMRIILEKGSQAWWCTLAASTTYNLPRLWWHTV